CADTLLMLLRGGQHQDLVDQWVRHQRIQTLGYVRNAILRSGRLRRFLALAVDSYDLVLRQKPQRPDMCEQGPIANTDQSQPNFLLTLHTLPPMRVTCYRTKDERRLIRKWYFIGVHLIVRSDLWNGDNFVMRLQLPTI